MKLPGAFIPAAVLAFALLCLPLKEAFVYPAASVTFDESGESGESGEVGAAQVRKVEMIVQGVKCKGTAEFFVSRYENHEGVLGLEAFAADHKVIVTYDASKMDPEQIRAIGEAPVKLKNGELRQLFFVDELRSAQIRD